MWSSRYYGKIAIDRAKTLFGAEYVNVQPSLWFSKANTVVLPVCLKPGDKILGLTYHMEDT